MFNELDRLAENPALFTLLRHYAALAAPDRQVWQQRQMQQHGSDARALTRLHGELLAYGWLEITLDEANSCYRITPSGLRALKEVQNNSAIGAPL